MTLRYFKEVYLPSARKAYKRQRREEQIKREELERKIDDSFLCFVHPIVRGHSEG